MPMPRHRDSTNPMQLSKNRFVLLWICSAAVVTFARCFNAIDIGDVATQIGAGQHLVAGKGLSVYSLEGEDDLARPARLSTLVHFPAGYSIYAATLIKAGLSLTAI